MTLLFLERELYRVGKLYEDNIQIVHFPANLRTEIADYLFKEFPAVPGVIDRDSIFDDIVSKIKFRYEWDTFGLINTPSWNTKKITLDDYWSVGDDQIANKEKYLNVCLSFLEKLMRQDYDGYRYDDHCEQHEKLIEELNFAFKRRGLGYEYNHKIGQMIPLIDEKFNYEAVIPSISVLSTEFFSSKFIGKDNPLQEMTNAYVHYQRTEYPTAILHCRKAIESFAHIDKNNIEGDMGYEQISTLLRNLDLLPQKIENIIKPAIGIMSAASHVNPPILLDSIQTRFSLHLTHALLLFFGESYLKRHKKEGTEENKSELNNNDPDDDLPF